MGQTIRPRRSPRFTLVLRNFRRARPEDSPRRSSGPIGQLIGRLALRGGRSTRWHWRERRIKRQRRTGRPSLLKTIQPGARGRASPRQDVGIGTHSDRDRQIVEDTVAPGRQAPVVVLLECRVQQPLEITKKPDDADGRALPLERVPIRRRGHGVDQGGPIYGVKALTQRVGNPSGAPAGRETHPPIRHVKERVAGAREFEIDEPRCSIGGQEHVVGARVAMHQGQLWAGRPQALCHRGQLLTRKTPAQQGDHLTRRSIDPTLAGCRQRGRRNCGPHDFGMFLPAPNRSGMQLGQGHHVCRKRPLGFLADPCRSGRTSDSRSSPWSSKTRTPRATSAASKVPRWPARVARLARSVEAAHSFTSPDVRRHPPTWDHNQPRAWP
jgi:hypothetical protein